MPARKEPSPGGWWLADGSIYCAGPRYYIDCLGECQGCGCGGGSFCPSCDGLDCECALGSCANRHVGCTEFRYGQCNQQIACSGRIACRWVSCTPPWLLDSSCTNVVQIDDSTANHFAPCQNGTPPPPPPGFVGMAATPAGTGYWLVSSAGAIKAFGGAVSHGSLAGIALDKPIVGIAATPSGNGYWLVAADGGIFTFGDARFDGSTGNIALARPIVGMSDDSATGGYRFVASDGGVFDFDAPFYGSLGNVRLTKPVVGMAATKTGNGYWLVASDGGIFSFGQAAFFGSLGDVHLVEPVVGMAATPTNRGYWMVAADGGIFTFGDATNSTDPSAASTWTRPSPGWRAHRRAMATGWSQPTAECSRSVTPTSTDRGPDDHRDRHGVGDRVWCRGRRRRRGPVHVVAVRPLHAVDDHSLRGAEPGSSLLRYGRLVRVRIGSRGGDTWSRAAVVAALAKSADLLGHPAWIAGIVAAAAFVAAAIDAGAFGEVIPIWRRQVDDGWLVRYRRWVYASGFGWQIGVGVATYIMTAAVFLMVILAGLTASPAAAFGLCAGFGLVRGLAVLATPGRRRRIVCACSTGRSTGPGPWCGSR